LVELTGDISFAMDYIEKDERLSYLAYYDLLTGLPNRALVSDRLNQLLHRPGYAVQESVLAVSVIDLDRFRTVNDTLGRHVGDTLLTLVADRLKNALPDAHGVARLHSDCFVAVVADVKSAADVAHILEEHVLDCMNRPFSVEGEELRITATAGIALFPGDGADADTLFRNAEIALRRAKVSGDRYLFYASQMNSRIGQRLSLETKLRRAVEQERFVLHYQPKVDLGSGRICGLEALIRWDDPDTGLVHPTTFVPILEELGLILPVGRWVIEKAAADYAQWVLQGLRPPRIAVNVSAIQFRRKDFVEDMAHAAENEQDRGLDLEITESVIMDDVELAILQLRALKEMGIGIAVDDFGTGYCSLSYIAKLPVDLLKIDQSFIANLASSADNMSIVFSIISLAHSLKLKVCAEGVETEEHAKLLRLIRCDEVQGYLFSRPVPAENIVAMLADRKAK
jgi:diguanylate cyclase (GGDEF)-like protein